MCFIVGPGKFYPEGLEDVSKLSCQPTYHPVQTYFSNKTHMCKILVTEHSSWMLLFEQPLSPRECRRDTTMKT